MLLWFVRHALYFRSVLKTESTREQLALGVTLGMLLGLVPKGNLTAVALTTVLCALHVDLGAGMLSACAFSLVGMFLDPLTHRLGLLLLTRPRLNGLWSWLAEVPWMAWTGFDNTVVLGSLVLGGLLAFPTYRIGLWLFRRRAVPETAPA